MQPSRLQQGRTLGWINRAKSAKSSIFVVRRCCCRISIFPVLCSYYYSVPLGRASTMLPNTPCNMSVANGHQHDLKTSIAVRPRTMLSAEKWVYGGGGVYSTLSSANARPIVATLTSTISQRKCPYRLNVWRGC